MTTRADGREPDQLRDVTFTRGWLEQAEGSVLVEYGSSEELEKAMAQLEGSLTTTVHGTDQDACELGDLIDLLSARSGRVLWNGWPTGVAVAWAMFAMQRTIDHRQSLRPARDVR